MPRRTLCLLGLALASVLALGPSSACVQTQSPRRPVRTASLPVSPPERPSNSGSDVIIAARPVKIAQLVGDLDRERGAPTANLTETRYRLIATDLGVAFRHNGRTFVLFGDSQRRSAQGLPVPSGDPIAFTTDANPDDGLDLTFVADASGVYQPVRVPGVSLGAFEVPMEGTSWDGKMYLYLTTDHSEQVVMGRSVVAVSEDDGRSFRYLYDLSRQHFINVSAVEVNAADWPGLPTSGAALMLFGSGSYRASDVRLACQPTDAIASGQGIRYLTGLGGDGQPLWSEREADAIALFHEPCVGELSVTYNRFLRRWVMLYNCELNPNGVRLRTAVQPWGPWSEAQFLYDPWDDGGYCHYIHASWQTRNCDAVHDPGHEDVWGGVYGPYQFEDLATGSDGETVIYFTLSTWNPYTVVLMRAALRRPASAQLFLPLARR